MNSEDSASEDDQARQKAEKRRAKKKRQRERRKIEKKKETEKEQEPEWDITSAFVANAVNHIKPKCRTWLDKNPRENQENEGKIQKDDHKHSSLQRGKLLAKRGISLAKEGQYSQAAELFSEAIHLDPEDYRYFGNRSYCYEQLSRYHEALADAEISIHLCPDWPKGYFRKGRALLGIQRYLEAEKSFKKVIQLDEDCTEAGKEIQACQVLQLMKRGFTQRQSISLLEQFKGVPAVIEAPISAKVLERNARACYEGLMEVDMDFIPDQSERLCPSLWVGNITVQVKEKQLRDLFKRYGEITSLRILGDRFCAFVNFKSPLAAASAMNGLQGKEIENTKLVIRYPDRYYRPFFVNAATIQAKVMPSQTSFRQKGNVTNECLTWRDSSSQFGENCRHRCIPESSMVDK